MNPEAAFLDKDGTLIVDVPYNVDPEHIRLMPHAAEGAALLQALGYRLFVVSNQPGLALGYFALAELEVAFARIEELLQAAGVRIEGFYFCPHDPDGNVAELSTACGCRKPRPGLLCRAASEHGLDLARSWLIGDILHDVEAAHRAGSRAVLVDNGHETEWQMSSLRLPDLVARDVLDAAQQIAARARGHGAAR